jgi:hypothetical protein
MRKGYGLYGVLAQLVERFFCKEKVEGSIPSFSTVVEIIRYESSYQIRENVMLVRF